MKKFYKLLVLFFLLTSFKTIAQNNCAISVPITAIPYNSGPLTTCGTVNDYPEGSYFEPFYGDGEDYVFSMFVSNAPVSYQMTLGGSAEWKILSIHSACPPTSANALGGIITNESGYGQTVINFPSNGLYFIFVDSWPPPDCGAFTLNITNPPPPPANDDCANAQTVTCATNYTGTTLMAANDVLPSGVLDCGVDLTTGIYHGVWFKYTPTVSGQSTFSACGSTFDTYIRVYSGADCASINQCEASDDDGCGTFSGPSSIDVNVTAGTTYYILLGGYGASSAGSYSFNISCPTDCIRPSNVFAQNPTSNTVDVSWDGTGNFILEYGPPGFTPGTGSAAGVGGTVINPATSVQTSTGLASSTSYDVYIRQDCSGTGNGFSLNTDVVSFTTLGPPPSNDNCAGATVVTCGTLYTGSTVNATNDVLPAVSCGGIDNTANGFYKGVWFRYTPTSSGEVLISSCGQSNYDSYLRVYTGTGCGAITACVGYDNSGCGLMFGPAAMILNVSAGTTYYILLGGYDNSIFSYGNYSLQITCPSSCNIPTSIAASSVTANTANISWSGSGSFILEYGLAGFTPGTGASAGVGGTVINPATSPQAITGLTASTIYSVYVRKNCTATGNGYSANSLVYNFQTLANAPANDNCTGAITIGPTAISTTNVGGTQSMPAVNCAGFTSPNANDVWYQFTTLANGGASIIVQNTTFPGLDIVVQAFSGSCGALTPIDCADATTQGDDEVLNLTGLQAGQTYFVRVYGYNSSEAPFTISVSGAALPITIQYLKGAKLSKTANLINWKINCTSGEANMTLEHSTDGRRFIPIYTITADYIRCQQPFEFTDHNPVAGINYYRLKTTDVDGDRNYSNIITILNNDKSYALARIAPNPVESNATLEMVSTVKTKLMIKITDVAGKIVLTQSETLNAGSNSVLLKLSHLAAGTYFINTLNEDGTQQTLRFIKQ